MKKLITLFLCFLMVKGMGQTLRVKAYGGIQSSIDWNSFRNNFSNVTDGGIPVGISSPASYPLSKLKDIPTTSSALSNFDVVIVIGINAFGSNSSTISYQQADALIDYVTNGKHVLLGSLEAVNVKLADNTLVDANKYLGEALLCGAATLTATPSRTTTINSTINPLNQFAVAYHPNNGNLLLNTTAKNVKTTKSYSIVSGVPSENVIMVDPTELLSVNCNNISALDFIVPAYPGLEVGNNSCGIQGFAILSGEACGPMNATTDVLTDIVRQGSALNASYAQLIYDFLYDKIAIQNRYTWSLNPQNTNSSCIPPPPLENNCLKNYYQNNINPNYIAPFESQTLTGTITYPSQSYYIANDITIASGAKITFTDAEVLLNNGVQITVAEDAELTIEGSHFYSCTQMWKGIKCVSERSKIKLNSFVRATGDIQGTIIEDAEIAIDMSTPNGVFSYKDDDIGLDVSNVIFNKNNIAIKLSNYHTIPSGIGSYRRNPANLNGVIFTSRFIKFDHTNHNWPNFQTMAVLKNQNTYSGMPLAPFTLTSPYIKDVDFDPTNNASLKPPFLYKKPQCGLLLQDNGNTKNMAMRMQKEEITENISDIQDLSLLFDNLSIGIDINNSPGSIYRALFQQPSLQSVSLTSAIGVRARNNNSSTTNNKTVAIGSNLSIPYNSNINDYIDNGFFGLNNAIMVENCYDVTVCRNVFRCGDNITNLGFKTIRAINCMSQNFRNLQIFGNECTNIRNAIVVNNGSTDPFNTRAIGAIDIYQNFIQAFHPNDQIARTGLESTFFGIQISGTNIRVTTNAGAKSINCKFNKLTNVLNGINVTNIKNKNFSITDNNIILGQLTANNFPSNGINVNGVANQSNTTGLSTARLHNRIENNYIEGPEVLLKEQNGISIDNNGGIKVQCNYARMLSNGYKFKNKCMSPRKIDWWDNIVEFTNVNGVTMENAEIGVQGMPDNPQSITRGCTMNNDFGLDADAWLQSYNEPHFKVNLINTDARRSPFVVLDDNPQSRWSVDGACNTNTFGTLPMYANSNGTTIIKSVNFNNQGACVRCTFTNQWGITYDQNTENNETIESIADGSYETTSDEPDNELYVLQKELFDANKNNTTGNPVVDSFIQNNSWSNFDFIYYTNSFVQEANWNAVAIMLQYFPISNKVDQNYFDYYTNIRNYYTGLEVDAGLIYTIANQCPVTNGNVVFAAQDLYNTINGEINYYNTNCDNGTSMRTAKPSKVITKNFAKPVDVSIYPNPATTNVTLIGKNITSLMIYNSFGKLIESTIYKSNNMLQVDMNKFPVGVYIFKILCADKSSFVKKVIKQ